MFSWSKTTCVVFYKNPLVWKPGSTVCSPELLVHGAHQAFLFLKKPRGLVKSSCQFLFGNYLLLLGCVLGFLQNWPVIPLGCVCDLEPGSFPLETVWCLSFIILDVTLSRKLFSKVHTVSKGFCHLISRFSTHRNDRVCCMRQNANYAEASLQKAVSCGMQCSHVPRGGQDLKSGHLRPDFVV